MHVKNSNVKKASFITLLTTTFLLSFTLKKDPEVYGMWKGGFGNSTSITEAIVDLKQSNKAYIYEDTGKELIKYAGTYEIKGDTAFILRYHEPLSDKNVMLYGNLNRSKNFVDGVWQSASQVKGSFYLQKQP